MLQLLSSRYSAKAGAHGDGDGRAVYPMTSMVLWWSSGCGAWSKRSIGRSCHNGIGIGGLASFTIAFLETGSVSGLGAV